MPDPVKTSRAYHSPRRRRQAEETRRSTLEAARRLFERDGYPATTMDAVAREAGVSVKTVYLAFATKTGLLRAVWDLVLKGDQDHMGVAERPWFAQVMAEPDADRQLTLLVQQSVRTKQRIGAMLRVIRSAAPIDPDAGALWALIGTDFHALQGAVVRSLDDKGALRDGLDAASATDILWTYNHPDVWLLLAGERGWSAEAFEAWFLAASRRELLGR